MEYGGAGVRQTNALRLRIFSSLFRRQLFNGEELHSGDVSSRLAKDIEQVSNVCTDTLPQMVITMIQLCGAFLLMRWFDAWLAWALLLLTPLAIVFGKLIARRLRQMTLDIRQDESRIQMHVQEGMEHNAVLRSLGSEQWVTGRFDSMQQRLRGNVIRFTVVTRLIMGCCFGLGYLLAFVWGGIGQCTATYHVVDTQMIHARSIGRKTKAGLTQGAQKATMRQLLEDLHQRYPRALIVGHRDLSHDRDCPCFDAYKEYADLQPK